jgi:hypothetical protein
MLHLKVFLLPLLLMNVGISSLDEVLVDQALYLRREARCTLVYDDGLLPLDLILKFLYLFILLFDYLDDHFEKAA